MSTDTPIDFRISKDEFQQFQCEMRETTDKMWYEILALQKQLLAMDKKLDALQGQPNGGQIFYGAKLWWEML